MLQLCKDFNPDLPEFLKQKCEGLSLAVSRFADDNYTVGASVPWLGGLSRVWVAGWVGRGGLSELNTLA